MKGKRNAILIVVITVAILLAIGYLLSVVRVRDFDQTEILEAAARRRKRIAWEEEHKKEVEKLGGVQKVVYKTAPNYTGSMRLVRQTITEIPTDSIHLQSGVLENGIAVMVVYRVVGRLCEGAYWVQNDRVYAANGCAKMWSPKLTYSKASIHFDSVKEAINK